MEKQSPVVQEVSFRFLAEFREWLGRNQDKDIVDIQTDGEWGDMKICVTYKEMGS